jgi:hypothetical protein
MNKRYQLQSTLAAVFAVVAFLALSSVAVIWANGLHYNPRTHTFEQTAVIAVEAKLDQVRVKLNGELMATETPWFGRGLNAGPYELLIERDGYFPFRKNFTLSPTQVGLVKDVTLIAQQPKISNLDNLIQLSETRILDAQLNLVNGELLDRGQLITRFSQDPLQAHRFNDGYLYQQDNTLRLYLPESNQDWLITTLVNNDVAALKLLPGAWQVMVRNGDQTELIELTVPQVSAASPAARRSPVQLFAWR